MSLAVGKLLIPAVVSATAFSLWKLLRFVLVYHPYRSPLRRLQGPKGTSFIFGNTAELMKDVWENDGAMLEQWLAKYGHVLRFIGVLSNNQLLTVDTRAINHILTHGNDYQKTPEIMQSLARIFGEGLIIVDGAQHRQQRRIMNPAFGPAQIRALTETFFAKADRLRDLWFSEVAKDPTAAVTGARIDIVPWLDKAALDIISLTGFNYDIGALDSSGAQNVLSKALATLFSAAHGLTTLDILQLLIPVLRYIASDLPILTLPPRSQPPQMRTAQRTMADIGKELLTNAKAAAFAGATQNGEIGKNNLHGRDLFSLLVKANMSTDIPESQRLSDKDVIAQVPTFFVAGHETTSSAISWALYALSQVPHTQTKLRDELLSVETDAPSMDELMALPYLDAVVRETLRLHAPVLGTTRMAVKDDELPVEKPYTDRYGTVRTTISIAKGDRIFLPILAINRSKALWGPDATEFKPERWDDLPEAVAQIPGVWGHMMTFFGGPRACIGYRYSLVETKAVLFSLVRAFEFELAVPASDIGVRTATVRRPVLQRDPTHQPQLPLLVRRHRRT